MPIDFPTDYDDTDSTFNDPNDMVILTLAAGVDDDDTLFEFNETDLADALNIPGYLTFEKEVAGDFEIVKYTARPGAGQLTVTRGALSSTAMAHDEDEQLVQDPVSAHLALIREMLLAVEQFQGLVGLKANLPGSCEPPEVYIATDTEEVFYAVDTDTWLLINRTDHGDYAGLGDDDHEQYQTEARKETWHDGLSGEHVTNPVTHDHSGDANMGPPFARFRHGLAAAKPENPTVECEVYYETDTGYLNFGVNVPPLTWFRYTIMPVGTGVFFEDDCPVGWTRDADFDDKMPRGAPADTWEDFVHAGTGTHSHDLPDLIAHAHNIPETEGSTDFEDDHDHDDIRYVYGGTGTSWRFAGGTSSDQTTISTGYAGEHQHSVVFPERTSTDVGDVAPVTDEADHTPPYKKLVFCRKD